MRETSEEVGLTVVVAEELGRRLHPRTGRTVHYVAYEVLAGAAHPADIDEVAPSKRRVILHPIVGG